MTIDELKALNLRSEWQRDSDFLTCPLGEGVFDVQIDPGADAILADVFLRMRSEILALVEACDSVEGMQHQEFSDAVDAFNAKLDSL